MRNLKKVLLAMLLVVGVVFLVPKDAEEVAGTYKGNDKFGVFGARKN